MYVITFYSFKGGVGRTLSLVNVGIELVRRGRNVLLVDFDLEAPGLDAFPLLRPRDPTLGIVDYVTEYLGTGSAPVASEYAFRCHAVRDEAAGALWVMPSGLRDSGYSSRLQAIDWQRLYSESDGYLLFEDLKLQWQQQLKVDYVLVDSRTGHTDVGGICTRQLPDAVALCFLPNEENTRGLETIVNEIRREAEGQPQKSIGIFFVPSNVPNLDDEYGILKRRVEEAKQRLGFDQPACIIHRYDSLSLLDNMIFALDRPQSRLAREYGLLARALTRENWGDRDVALQFLSEDALLPHRAEGRIETLDSIMKRLRLLHARDGEVLHGLGNLARRLGREEEAKALKAESLALGFRDPEMILDTAHRAFAENQYEAALTGIREAVACPKATYFDLNRAIRLLRKIDVRWLEWLMDSPALHALHPNEQASLCDEMLASRAALPVAERVLKHLLARLPDSRGPAFRTSRMLCLIGQRKFDEAMQVLSATRPQPGNLGTVDAFNYAMAEWGATRRLPVDLFSRVADISFEADQVYSDKNACQCISIAHWAANRLDDAWRFWGRAQELAIEDASESFSGWRYLRVSADQFRSDLESVNKMITGAPITPAVFAEVE